MKFWVTLETNEVSAWWWLVCWLIAGPNTHSTEVLNTQSRRQLSFSSYRCGHYASHVWGEIRVIFRKPSTEANQIVTCRIRLRSCKSHMETLGLNARNVISMVVWTWWIWCLGAATLNPAVGREGWLLLRICQHVDLCTSSVGVWLNHCAADCYANTPIVRKRLLFAYLHPPAPWVKAHVK